jgi:putative membrane protein
MAEDYSYAHRALAAEPHRVALNMLVELDADIGICERILSSPVPPTYTRFTSRILITWLACIPLALAHMKLPALTVIVGTLLTSYIMVGIDEIAIEIEEPMRLMPLNSVSEPQP